MIVLAQNSQKDSNQYCVIINTIFISEALGVILDGYIANYFQFHSKKSKQNQGTN